MDFVYGRGGKREAQGESTSLLKALTDGAVTTSSDSLFYCLRSRTEKAGVMVRLASLLLTNRHETSVRGPAQSSKDEYAAHTTTTTEKAALLTF